MRSIQEVGVEILDGKPRKFYVFAGTEYGVKLKYIDLVAEVYQGRVKTADTEESVLATMRVKHFFPLEPTLYVIRYDDEFISSLDIHSADSIQNTKIVGTIICIYENPKDVQKLDKFLGAYTVSLDAVAPRFLKNYLKQDFLALSDDLVDSAMKASTDYNQARNICRCMTYASPDSFRRMTDEEICNLFGYKHRSVESELKEAVAARNFKLFLKVLDSYDELESALYSILATMLEMEKLIHFKHADSPLRPYVQYWTLEDVYNYFVFTYRELKRLRSSSNYDVKNSLVLIGSLLCFRTIPSSEVLHGV